MCLCFQAILLFLVHVCIVALRAIVVNRLKCCIFTTGIESEIRTHGFRDLQSLALGHSAISILIGFPGGNRTHIYSLGESDSIH